MSTYQKFLELVDYARHTSEAVLVAPELMEILSKIVEEARWTCDVGYFEERYFGDSGYALRPLEDALAKLLSADLKPVAPNKPLLPFKLVLTGTLS